MTASTSTAHPEQHPTFSLRILNLPSQPNLNPAFLNGYFFIPYFMALRSLNLQGKEPLTWETPQTTEIKTALDTCFTNFATLLKDTDEKGLRCFVKEHSEFLFDPSAFSGHLDRSKYSSDLFVGFKSCLRNDLPTHLLLSPKQGPSPEDDAQNNHSIYYSPNNHTLLPDAFLGTWKPTFLFRHPALVFSSQYRVFSDLQKIRDDQNNWDVTMTLHWPRKLYELYVEILPKAKTTMDMGSKTHCP